jgi:hypothetical protein
MVMKAIFTIDPAPQECRKCPMLCRDEYSYYCIGDEKRRDMYDDEFDDVPEGYRAEFCPLVFRE